MWWKKKREPPLRDQLIEAREKIIRQIVILRAPAYANTNIAGGNRSTIAELEAELERVKQALAELDGATDPST